MCGINGIYGSLSQSDGSRKIAKMNKSLAHRGPDADGFIQKPMILLGHTRLSIIDLSTNANQPMQDDSGRYTLIFNGEIYNYRTLRESLTDYPFKTQSDTEVLLAGLIKFGASFLSRCNGMFALALWDSQTEELLLARDRMGIKPLYYARTNEHIIFSSEIRSLLDSELIPGELNHGVLGEYLRYQTVHGTNTILKGIFMLPPGSIMNVSDHEIKISSFWNPVEYINHSVAQLSYNETTALIKQKLEESVNRRLIADVPMGAFLSGGIDSSAIVALASNQKKRLRTFTISFDNSEFSEAKYARIIADKFNTDHAEINLAPQSLLENLPAALKAMDHPSGDGINTYLVSKAAKQAGISAVLSGLGGDELFAGYPIFKQYYQLRDKGWLMSFPKFLRAFAGNALQVARPGVESSKIKQIITEDYLDLENVYQYSREVASREVNSKLSRYGNSGEMSVFNLVKQGVGYQTPGYTLPILSRVSYAEIATYLQAVLLRDSDQMSMAHALEIRVPFLDHELVSTVMGVPDKYKFPTSPKKLLVDAMGDLLPSEIVNRPKMGFTFPWDSWMRNELKDFCGDHLAALGANDAFNAKAVSNRWNDFLKGKPQVTWSRLWYLCVLQAWMSENGIK